MAELGSTSDSLRSSSSVCQTGEGDTLKHPVQFKLENERNREIPNSRYNKSESSSSSWTPLSRNHPEQIPRKTVHGAAQTRTAADYEDVNRAQGATPSPSHEDSEGPKTDKPFWDVFRVVDMEMPKKEVFDQKTLKVVKVVVYILLFLLLLVACVGQRLGLMAMISNLPPVKAVNDTLTKSEEDPHPYHHAFLAIVITIPYVLTSLSSFFKWLFGNHPTPGSLTWISVLLVEAIHSFGLSLLVFLVLPKYDLILGSLLLSATCIVPSLLMITCTSWTISGDTKIKAGLKKILDIVALLCQFSVIPVLIFLKYFGGQSSPREPLHIATLMILFFLFFGFILSSLKCWENFVDGKAELWVSGGYSDGHNFNNSLMNKVLKIRYELQEGRHCVAMVSGLVKIVVTCTVVYGVIFLHTPNQRIIETNKNVSSMVSAFLVLYKEPLRFSALLLVTISGFVAYYTSYMACKLQMQIVSFSVPLLLCVPVTQGLLALNCYYYDILQYISVYRNTCDECGQSYCYYYYMGIPWLVSMLWICRHIWSPKQGRLELFERLFIDHLYCGILTQENLLLNRRRHQEELRHQKDMRKPTQPCDQYFFVEPDPQVPLHEQKDSSGIPPYIPFVYACATMWHETRVEMTQLLKSLFRLDKDQALCKSYELKALQEVKEDQYYRIFQLNCSVRLDKDQALKEASALIRCDDTRERYSYQAHIFFDDALELNDDEKWQANKFVRQLLQVMDEALSSVHHKFMKVHDPTKVITPYGAQLVWEMPGGNLLYVHLKDKQKIRHRKRWSQVMYMYYLLGYQLLKDSADEALSAFHGTDELNRDDIIKHFNIDVQKKTQNTFILALDGDTDFSPDSVRILLDKMSNEKVAAVCGRTHPIGSGEDRWLSTLLLQQGYYLDYAAAADAYSFAPEGFNEFFNQRRRWTPSILANIIDLLTSSEVTVARNANISYLYIIYQIAMMAGTVLGPGTIIMMIAGAIEIAFGLSLLWSYVISLVIPTIYIIVCFTTPTNIQLLVAQVLNALYLFIMMAVIAGIVVTAITISPPHPSVMFTCLLFFVYVFAGILHWKEINCLPHCLLYFLCIPSGSLLLFIYSLCNLNNVSWGTREIPQRKSRKEARAEGKKGQEKEDNEKRKDGLFARFFFSSTHFQEIRQLVDSLKDRPGPRCTKHLRSP